MINHNTVNYLHYILCFTGLTFPARQLNNFCGRTFQVALSIFVCALFHFVNIILIIIIINIVIIITVIFVVVIMLMIRHIVPLELNAQQIPTRTQQVWDARENPKAFIICITI